VRFAGGIIGRARVIIVIILHAGDGDIEGVGAVLAGEGSARRLVDHHRNEGEGQSPIPFDQAEERFLEEEEVEFEDLPGDKRQEDEETQRGDCESFQHHQVVVGDGVG